MRILLLLFFYLWAVQVNAQVLDSLVIRSDSGSYNDNTSRIELNSREYFYFELGQPDGEIELTVYSTDTTVQAISLAPSAEFTESQPIRKVDETVYRGIVKFENIARSRYLRFVLEFIRKDSSFSYREYRLYPVVFPSIRELTEEINVFSGEEKMIPLNITNDFMIDFDDDWYFDDRVEYKVIRQDGRPMLDIKSDAVGMHRVEVVFTSSRPFLNENGQLTTNLKSFYVDINVSPSQISFLNFDAGDYYYEPGGSNRKVVKIDYNRRMELNKTYRIEDQEQPGGKLIAELFTRTYIENENKILATLQTYNYHREEEGYLYLKDGDVTRFFTNFNSIPTPEIEKVSILRQGQDWTGNLAVYPNDSIEIRIEGTGLEKAKIRFNDGKFNARLDSSRVSDRARYYSLAIPFDIKESRISISMNDQPTRFDLPVREHQKPRKLNFIMVDYGDGGKRVATDYFDKPVLYYGEIRDIILEFQPEMIDFGNDFHGPQFIEIEVTIRDQNKRLLELKTIENIKILPSESSPRFPSYSRSNASPLKVNLSRYLSISLPDLENWTSIELRIRHDKTRYGDQGYTNYVTIYKAVSREVDLDVSFPTGLLTKQFNEPGLGRLSGISTAAQAQFTFYQPNQINKQFPLKLGLGFIALNALTTLNEEDGKDLGIVAIASFYPINRNSNVNFPIHFGFGYLLQNETAFLLIGPGIQFNF